MWISVIVVIVVVIVVVFVVGGVAVGVVRDVVIVFGLFFFGSWRGSVGCCIVFGSVRGIVGFGIVVFGGWIWLVSGIMCCSKEIVYCFVYLIILRTV